MKIYASLGLYYRRSGCVWEFWSTYNGQWVPSLNATYEGLVYERWWKDLKLIGNNFRLK